MRLHPGRAPPVTFGASYHPTYSLTQRSYHVHEIQITVDTETVTIRTDAPPYRIYEALRVFMDVTHDITVTVKLVQRQSGTLAADPMGLNQAKE